MYRMPLPLMLAVGLGWWALGPGGSAAQEGTPPPVQAADHPGSAASDHPPSRDDKSGHAAEEHGPAAALHAAEAAHGHAAQGHGHDPYDLSHGNASANLTSPADLRFDMSIASFVVFLILLGVLYKFAWGPIALALQQREETIARQMEEARLASERAAQQLREYQARLAAATEEARQIVAEARKDAELARDRLLAEARESAQKERDRAVAEIAVARNQALEQIAQRSVQTALALAGQILRRELRPQEHEQLIGDAVQQFTHLKGS